MCHQTVGLVSRHLEAAGIPNVVAGSARDIVEECGVARHVFTDFPLGNPTGKPGDVAMQRDIVSICLDVLENAWTPRTTVQTDYVWDGDDNQGWRDNFMHVGDDNRDLLAAAGAARRQNQAAAKSDGRARTS